LDVSGISKPQEPGCHQLQAAEAVYHPADHATEDRQNEGGNIEL
jgi:hypothetical protein